MNKKIMTVVLSALIAVTMCMPVFAGETDTANNYADTGNMVTMPSETVFSAFLAGQSVNASNGTAEGSLYAAGQEVSVNNVVVGETLYAAGNSVTLSGCSVIGNVFAAGNNVVVGEATECRSVYAFGNILTFSGEAKAAYLAGSHVTFAGKVDGDVVIEADSVEIADDAVITGDLKVTSPNEPEVGNGASIGDYSFDQVQEDDEGPAPISIGAKIIKKLGKCLYWVVAMVAFGMLLCWLFDKHLTGAAHLMKEKPGAMIASGIIGWMCIPVAAVLILFSYILAPAGGMILLAYTLLVCAGLAFAGASLVRIFLPNMNVFLSAAIGIAALEVVRMIPVIGTVVGIAADMYLIAYVIQTVWAGRLRKKEEKTAAVQTVSE